VPTATADAAGPGPPRASGVDTISGAALYVGSLIGPGVLLIPALALRTAGPASIISWGIMVVLSAPLALTFAGLGVRMPAAVASPSTREPASGSSRGWSPAAGFSPPCSWGHPPLR
jgi:hypothetical protein